MNITLRPPHHLRAIAVALLLVATSCGPNTQPLPTFPAVGLPPIADLPGGGVTRNASETQFSLMWPGPIERKRAHDSGPFLDLEPLNEGDLAYAVYALQGFPGNGSVLPTSVTIDFSSDLTCWLAFADFAQNRWELMQVDSSGKYSPTSNSLVSPEGTFYVAVLDFWADGEPPSDVRLNSLVVEVSSDLAIPTPYLNTISATNKTVWRIPTYYNAASSDPGPGASIVKVTYDWNDGSPPEQTSDPLTEVSHVWQALNDQTVTLTIENDQGSVIAKDFKVNVQLAERSVLVVYNSDIPESLDLANYYASSRTGRAVDPEYILGLSMGNNADADFDRATYNALIRDPIKNYLDTSGSKSSLKYFLLCKGVPHRITDTGGVEDGSASVDSELCLLYSDLGPGNGGYPYDGWLINGPNGLNMAGDGFYLSGNSGFKANEFQVCYDPTWQQPDSGDEVQYTLNYLVGRLSAYTYDEAKLLVDRSVNAYQPSYPPPSEYGWTIFDTSPNDYFGMTMNEWDTMSDPVFPYTVDVDSGYDLLSAAGFNVFEELSAAHVWSDYPTLPVGAADNVIGYCSWGTHAGQQPLYILEDLNFTYRPGACFMSYESYNAWNFDGNNLGNRAGQGQICDFFRMGGTLAIGNVWEPYNLGIGDERWVFDRYINKEDRWIEAAYKGLRLLSWMEVVVGDPLCTVIGH